MAPKKYVGCFNYEGRWLQDDFFVYLPNSREGREAKEMQKSLTGEVHPGIKDRYYEVVDTHMPNRGLQIFRWCYGQENLGCPNNNVWRYDLGKLLMPTIFKDMDLLQKQLTV